MLSGKLGYKGLHRPMRIRVLHDTRRSFCSSPRSESQSRGAPPPRIGLILVFAPTRLCLPPTTRPTGPVHAGQTFRKTSQVSLRTSTKQLTGLGHQSAQSALSPTSASMPTTALTDPSTLFTASSLSRPSGRFSASTKAARSSSLSHPCPWRKSSTSDTQTEGCLRRMVSVSVYMPPRVARRR